MAASARVEEREGVSESCTVRRAMLSYACRVLGPGTIGALAQDSAERAALVELARTDPEAAARRVFRD